MQNLLHPDRATTVMDPVRTIALLIHPALALGLIFWLLWQHGWRKKGSELRGEDRQAALESHIKWGERIVWAAIILVLIAMIGRVIAGWRSGDWTSELVPSNIHGWTGPIGILLLWSVVRQGQKTIALKEAGESFVEQKRTHGRYADFVIALVALHAFLGFLYIFTVI